MNMKKANKLTQEQLDELAALNNLPEEQINTDDIPEILDWSGARRGVFYRPNGRDDAQGDVERDDAGAQQQEGE